MTSQQIYDIGGNSLDVSNAVYVTGVTSYTVTPPTFANGLSSSPGSFSSTAVATAPNSLVLAFGYNYGDATHLVSSTAYSSSSPMNVIYQSNSTANLNNGIAMLEASIDPFTAPNHAVTFTGTWNFAGSGANSLFPQIFTVVIQ